MKNMLKGAAWGGLLGGGISRTVAQRDWKSRNMHDAKDAWGGPLFQRRHIQDEVGIIMNRFDMERWEAMQRNYVREHTSHGVLAGAIAGGAALSYFGKRDEEPPRGIARRMPHPMGGGGLGIHGGLAAPAA